MPKILEWFKAHPYEAGGVVVVGGLAIWFLFLRGGGSSSSSGTDPNAAAYYAAESAQGQAGDALQAIQIQSQAATAQDLINANADVQNNTTWATTDLQTAQVQSDAATALAPYAVENTLVNALGNVASQPPTAVTSTNTSSNSGFFGIGASNSVNTSTQLVPNPAAVDAAGLLGELSTTGFTAGH